MKLAPKKSKPSKPSTEYVLPVGKALGMRSCKADFSSPSDDADGFKWPAFGLVVAPDWIADKDCGHGLHLLAHGEGAGNLLCYDDGARWLVCEYDPEKAIDLDGKIKVPECTVVFCGDESTAPSWIVAHDPLARSVVRSKNTGGDDSKNTGGDRSTNTGGDDSTNTGGDDSTNTGGDRSTNTGGYGSKNTGGVRSKNTGGDRSTNTGGDRSTNTGGYDSTNTGGYDSTNTGGYGSKNTGGDDSTNTGGDRSTNTGGDGSKNTGGVRSKNTGGDRSTNTGGYGSTNTGGYGSKAKSGDLGVIAVDWWDGKRRRIAVGYVGEDGIEPNTFYRCDDAGKLVKTS